MQAIRLIILSCSLLLALTTYSSAHIEYSNEIRNQDAKLIEICNTSQSNIHKSDNLICFIGDITEASAKSLIEALELYPDATLVIDSPGGLAHAAIAIGLIIHSQQTRLIVSNRCYSSCANYILPAAFRLVVWDKTLVLLHGSIPRERVLYIDGQLRLALEKEGTDPTSLSASDLVSHPAFREAYDAFPEYARTAIAEETEFFAEIGPDETYLHRYWEILRNVRTYANKSCQPKDGLFVLVGPQMAKEFSFTNVEYFWWPGNQEIIAQANKKEAKIHKDRTLVLDMNLMPSYIPGRGFVEQSDCLKAEYQKTSQSQ